ncbi:MAG: DUF4864 domain-containing protein [Rhodobacteraceae bacterium]|nr:DUF4864 domain-containing protein [Paracoccaceae bacterium]
MRKFLTACVAMLMLAAPLSAQDAAPEGAIQGVISSQMDAFRAGDVPGAWAHASPTIKRLFGTERNFAMMVQQGYPMVWQPGDIRFLELREVDGKQRQEVIVRDADNVFHVLEYDMIKTEDGWRIDGVHLVPAPQIGA